MLPVNNRVQGDKHGEEPAATCPYCVMVFTSAGTRKREMDTMYYSPEKLISRNGLLNFVVGERGVGKSFSFKNYVVDRYLKTGEQFIYLRRYKEELQLACSYFFKDLQCAGFYQDHEFKVKGSKNLTIFYIDDEIVGYGVALSTSNILKSTAFPEVKTIIFDEFILDTGIYHYLKSEVSKTLDVIETVFRLKDGRVFFLGNAISIDNPYFNYFNLDLPYNSEFKSFKDGLIVVNYIKNLEYRAKKKSTRFGRLIDGTDYGRYAIDNKMLRDDSTFIGKKGNNPHFWHILCINNQKYGVWHDTANGRLYISEDYDPTCGIIYAVSIDDHTPDTKFVSIRSNGFFKAIIEYYKNSDLYFENQKIKNNIIPILRRCLSYT